MERKMSDVSWRLYPVMSERGIRSAAELQRRLERYGMEISSHHLSRMMSKLPARLNTDVLALLMTELDCEASDLLYREGTPKRRLPPVRTEQISPGGKKVARQLVWRLHPVMAERNIRTATDLHRRLEPFGIDITSQQLTRIVAKLPARLNTDVLVVLMTALDCEASDLFWLLESTGQVQPPSGNPGVGATSSAGGGLALRRPGPVDVPDSVLGPKVGHFVPPDKGE